MNMGAGNQSKMSRRLSSCACAARGAGRHVVFVVVVVARTARTRRFAVGARRRRAATFVPGDAAHQFFARRDQARRPGRWGRNRTRHRRARRSASRRCRWDRPEGAWVSPHDMWVERIGEGEADPGDARFERSMDATQVHPHGSGGAIALPGLENGLGPRHRTTRYGPTSRYDWYRQRGPPAGRMESDRRVPQALRPQKFSRKLPPVALATAATIFCAAASISGSVSVRSFGWRRTAMASDFALGHAPCLQTSKRSTRSIMPCPSAPAAARIRSAAATGRSPRRRNRPPPG